MAKGVRHREVDVAIAGGGFVGMALALALAGPGAGTRLAVAVIDRVAPARRKNAGLDGRAMAVSAASKLMLEAIGAWGPLGGEAQPIERMVITDSRLGARIRPNLLDFGEPPADGMPMAWIVESRHLHAGLLEALHGAGEIAVMAPESVQALEMDGGQARLALEGGGAVSARVAAACDGRESRLRALAGIGCVRWAYPQTAIVATVAHERPHEGIARQHFLPAGPFAILPLTGNRSSLVWTEERTEAERIMALDEAGFAAELALRFGPHLGEVEPAGPRFSYPLSFQLARTYVEGRLALLGDAAHVVHPIAGLGLNLGLRDAAALAEVVVDALRLGLDPGASPALERYQRWRRFDNAGMALAMDALNRLFSNDLAPVRALRDLGLAAVDRLGPVKRQFAGEAAGLSGEPPRLMRGEAI